MGALTALFIVGFVYWFVTGWADSREPHNGDDLTAIGKHRWKL